MSLAVTNATLPLSNEEGFKLVIACIPKFESSYGHPTMVDCQLSPNWDEPTEAPIQLLEETQYRYEIVADAEVSSIEPIEILIPDNATLLTGGISTRRSTGTITIEVTTIDGRVMSAEIEVRSRKLDYRTDYRSMLNRVADEGTELVQAVFGPSTLMGFRPDGSMRSPALYQRFALLSAFLDSAEFQSAMQILRVRPHTLHQSSEQHVDPAKGVRPSSALVRSISGPGPRQIIRNRPWGSTVPMHVPESMAFETLNTVPNQFVRFALEEWLLLVEQLERAIMKISDTTTKRSSRSINAVKDQIRSAQLIPAVSEAGRLTNFPTGNTVLTNRAGYRDLFRAFLVSQIAARISWDGGEDVFGAGLRNVATLYEYWVFLELARIVESLPGFQMDRRNLVTKTSDGLSLDLKSGSHVAIEGTGTRHGRDVKLALHFNRTFSNGSGSGSSWTRTLRPDCSLHIKAAEPTHETWIHFDAKYRVHKWFGAEESESANHENPPTASSDQAKNDDLMKMHAYRDALRKTAGAYVLYPGESGNKPDFKMYHEVLPGLGAFVLRPSTNGQADESSSYALRAFIADVIDHIAADGTSRGRSNYWEHRAYEATSSEVRLRNSSLNMPPADTKVLLGYVRDNDHLAWIRDSNLYNLRAEGDGRTGEIGLTANQLACDVITLYGPTLEEPLCFRLTGALRMKSADEMKSERYPNPRSSNYICLEFGDKLKLPGFDKQSVETIAPGNRAPLVTDWLSLAT